MTKVISFCLGIYFAVLSLFGVAFKAPDLKAGSENQISEISEENLEPLRKIFESETDFLASLQLENGAIPMTRVENGEAKVNPYFADVAALALLDSGRISMAAYMMLQKYQ